MKKSRFVYLLLSLSFISAAVVSCYSCTPENNSQELPPPDKEQEGEGEGQNPSTEDPTGPQPGTYKFVASPIQGSWKAGDRIYVHGNIGSQTQTVVLTAEDISSDGKTASAKLESTVTESYYDPDGLYAAWPEESVYQYKGVLKTKTTFMDCETPLTISYLEGDTFKFIDVSSLITFKVDGDYDSYAIAENNRDGICITRFEAEYSSEGKKFNYKKNDGYPYRYGSIVSGKADIWFPGDFVFNTGYTLFLGKANNWTATYSVNDKVTLTSGKTLDIGNITASVTPYSGLAPRMPRMGDETKFTVSFNELSGICLSEEEDFLWGVGDDGDLAKLDFEGNVLYKFHIGGDAEDVSLNRDTKDLLIGLEPDGIGLVKGPGFNARATTVMSIPAAKNYGNAGVEGCNYYKDGLAFAGAQSNSHIFLCDLESKKVLWSAMLYDKNRVSEIAGFSYDPLTGWLWIIDSEAKKVFVFAVDHTVTDGNYSVSMGYLGAYPVGGANPESVCVDHKHSCIWVGDDYGETSYLYRYQMEGLDDFNI
ncbi:MAG: hypothetical protein IJU21_07355 [Bacteroidales bacterium]|nr:hypothetical protein [Bacteroidales bacterium]